MIDTFDILAFIVFGVLVVAGVVVVVTLGSLPGRIAQQRGYPQLAAIAVAGWLGVATLGLLWPGMHKFRAFPCFGMLCVRHAGRRILTASNDVLEKSKLMATGPRGGYNPRCLTRIR